MIIVLGIEKREYKRVKLNLKVAVSNASGRHYSQDSHAKIVNLSEGGICFESGIEFKKQEKCYLVFTLHNQRSALKVIGDILWRQKNPYLSTYGLEFSNLSFLDKMVLKRFVRLYFGEETIMDKSLFFWEITFLVLLMYLLSKACVLLPLGFTLIIMVIVTLSFYFWLLIEEKKR
ncbi:PilZ domain-containing protein [bacterium]|nr:PilZ domain-containing protein [bacterium]